MNKLTAVGATALMIVGSIGGAIAYVLGGWDNSIQTLLVFMLIDYLTGIALAVLNKSTKTKDGGLSSKAGFRGIFKKAGMLVVAEMKE